MGGCALPKPILLSIACLVALCAGCSSKRHSTIAFIPRTTADDLWEQARLGAFDATDHTGYGIYWNGPTVDTDIETQIALLDETVTRQYAGIVIAPGHSLALMSPVQEAASRGIDIVVVGSPLPQPPSGNLFYILNDDEEEGKIAAQRIGERLHGNGSVAIVGLNPADSGQYLRIRSFELTLGQEFPAITITSRNMDSYSEAQAEQTAQRILSGGHVPDAILGLTSRGTLSTVHAIEDAHIAKPIVLVGCDQNYALLYYLSQGKIDSLIAENTYAMGYRAAQLVLSLKAGKAASHLSHIEPVLVTRENMNSPDLLAVLTHDERVRP